MDSGRPSRENRGADTPDVAVDVAVHGKFTISGRQIVNRVKWTLFGAGFVTFLLLVPHIDGEFLPASTDPTVVQNP